MLCDDRKCPCHPRRKKPWQKIKMVLRGSKPGQFCQLDQPGSELDVIFDFITGGILLKETVQDPEYRDASYSIYMDIDPKHLRFVNLKGLPNTSLILSLRIRGSAGVSNKRKMVIKEKYRGFSPNAPDSRLYTDLYACDWAKQHLEMVLPGERLKSWRTVALILKTFKQITPKNWFCMVKMNLKKAPTVGGLDWMDFKQEMMVEAVKEPSPVSSPEKKKKHIEFAQDGAKPLEQKHQILVQC